MLTLRWRHARAAAAAIALGVSLTAYGNATASPAAVAAVAATPAVQQLITVKASSYGTTYATVRAYRLSGGHWVQVAGPWTARVGYHGVARPGAKREGDGKTPSGTYGLSFFFGVQPLSGVSFPYWHVYSYHYWDDDPASPRYNEWVNARKANPGRNPEPMHNVPAYNYGAVIAYNTARVPGLGSGIFLHVGTGGATAGCVSLPASQVVALLRWLKPSLNPRITITG